jgi:TolB-like protein
MSPLLLIMLSCSRKDAAPNAADGTPVQRQEEFAVLDFQGESSEPTLLLDLSDTTRDAIGAALKNKDLYVMSRAKMEDILFHKGKNRPCRSDECSVEVGLKLGVEYVIVGKLSHPEGRKNVDLKMLRTSDQMVLSQRRYAAGTADQILTVSHKEAQKFIDGNFGIQGAFQPYEISAPKSLENCLEQRLPEATIGEKNIQLLLTAKPSVTSFFLPSAYAQAQLLLEGRELASIRWTAFGETEQEAVKNAKTFQEMKEPASYDEICQELGDALDLALNGRRKGE